MALMPLLAGLAHRDADPATLPTGVSFSNPEVSWASLQASEGGAIGGTGKTRIDNYIAGTGDFKLRLDFGYSVPSWVKAQLGTVTTYTAQDPQAPAQQVVRYWQNPTLYLSWLEDFISKMAALYDGVIPAIFAASVMAVYSEPCLKQFGDSRNIQAWSANGYDRSSDLDIFHGELNLWGQYFTQSRISVAFNEYQYIKTGGSLGIDEAQTAGLMSYLRTATHAGAILANNSLREQYVTASPLSQLYQDIIAHGKPFGFQTATWSKISVKGSSATESEKHDALLKVIDWVIAQGGHYVELPSGNNLTQAERVDRDQKLKNNVGAGSPTPFTFDSWCLIESDAQVGTSIDTLLALAGCHGMSYTIFWDDYENPNGTWHETALDTVASKCAAAGKPIAVRVRCGSHTPSFALGSYYVPTTGQAAGLTVPLPCDPDGTINETFWTQWKQMMDHLEAWALAAPCDVEIIHCSWFGGKSAEIWENPELNQQPGCSQANVKAAYLQLLDYAQALSTTFAIEFPISGFQSPGSTLKPGIASDMQANARAQYLQMNNIGDDPYIVWPYSFKPHQLQMIHADPPAPRTDEWDWVKVAANVVKSEAAGLEVQWRCWWLNTNRQQLWNVAAQYASNDTLPQPIDKTLQPQGIPSPALVGTPTLTVLTPPPGGGNPVVTLNVTGIPTAAAVPTGVVLKKDDGSPEVVSVTEGIGSAEAFGTAQADQTFVPTPDDGTRKKIKKRGRYKTGIVT